MKYLKDVKIQEHVTCSHRGGLLSPSISPSRHRRRVDVPLIKQFHSLTIQQSKLMIEGRWKGQVRACVNI